MILGALALGLLLQVLPQNPQGFVQGAIGGKLLTADGVPAVAVRVVAIKVPNTGDLSPDYSPNYFDLASPNDRTLTDNQGNFQLREIVPGRYYLLAGATPYGTFYPGEGNIRGAEILDIRPGTEVLDYNFKLVHRLGGKLSGRINAPPGLMQSRVATATGGPLEELLEVPIGPDGSFEFGHMPPGKYLVSLNPPTPGIAALPVTVAESDISGVELVPLPTNKITGRIISRNGPIPHGILGFFTERTYVGGKINDNGTFSVDLHSARHQIDFAGLPVGYSLASVRMGGQDMTQQGIVVNNADVSDVVITVNAPTKLATIRGKISGLAPEKFSSTILELTGPTFTKLHADVQQDSTFEFPTVVPGLYKLVLKGIGETAQVPEMAPITVIIDSFRTVDVSVVVPSQ